MDELSSATGNARTGIVRENVNIQELKREISIYRKDLGKQTVSSFVLRRY